MSRLRGVPVELQGDDDARKTLLSRNQLLMCMFNPALLGMRACKMII